MRLELCLLRMAQQMASCLPCYSTVQHPSQSLPTATFLWSLQPLCKSTARDPQPLPFEVLLATHSSALWKCAVRRLCQRAPSPPCLWLAGAAGRQRSA